jgi:hypothetical protein
VFTNNSVASAKCPQLARLRFSPGTGTKPLGALWRSTANKPYPHSVRRSEGRRNPMSDVQVDQGWWQATDGKWYPPERHPNFRPTGIPPSGMPPSGLPPLSQGPGLPGLPEEPAVPTQTLISAPRFRGAAIVSTVFKVAAWLVLIGGVITAIATYQHLHSEGSSDPVGAAIGVLAGAVLGASAFAFFGYVLDLLRASVLEARTSHR